MIKYADCSISMQNYEKKVSGTLAHASGFKKLLPSTYGYQLY